jgi:hypothetical protein
MWDNYGPSGEYLGYTSQWSPLAKLLGGIASVVFIIILLALAGSKNGSSWEKVVTSGTGTLGSFGEGRNDRYKIPQPGKTGDWSSVSVLPRQEFPQPQVDPTPNNMDVAPPDIRVPSQPATKTPPPLPEAGPKRPAPASSFPLPFPAAPGDIGGRREVRT